MFLCWEKLMFWICERKVWLSHMLKEVRNPFHLWREKKDFYCLLPDSDLPCILTAMPLLPYFLHIFRSQQQKLLVIAALVGWEGRSGSTHAVFCLCGQGLSLQGARHWGRKSRETTFYGLRFSYSTYRHLTQEKGWSGHWQLLKMF